MTEVRIRHEDQSRDEAGVLGDVPFADMESVIPMLKRWGVHDGSDTCHDDMYAQFIHEEKQAYFEVMYTTP